MKVKKVLSLGIAAVMTVSVLAACGSSDEGTEAVSSANIPTIDQINVGEDYQDLTASIKVLTNRTDIVDTVYKGYADQFMKVYPNITVTYEGITDYEESLNLRLTNGDWGDLCFIPTSVNKNELSSYFTPLGGTIHWIPSIISVRKRHMTARCTVLPTAARRAALCTTKKYGRTRASRNFPQHPTNSSIACRRSRTIRMWKRLCTPISPPGGLWAHGMLISASPLQGIRIS